MSTFMIEAYKVSSYLERFRGETRPSRVLELTGPVLDRGGQNRALFAFDPQFDGDWSSPVAGYITDGDSSGLSLVGWFPLAEFSYYYDIARAERPIHVHYEYREEGSTTGYLRMVGLGTSVEPIGEGPSESVESISARLAEHLTPFRPRFIPMPMEKDLPMRDK
jgi:hypothetical protein